MRHTSCLVFAACIAACYGAHRDHVPAPDGGLPVCEGLVCDQVPASTCVDDTTLRSFSASCSDGACSYPSSDVACGAAGCCGDHCCTIAPSNTSDFGALTSNGLDVAPPNGTFDTDADCAATSALGACTVVTRTGLSDACVCRADRITIGTLAVTGSRALVLLAAKEVLVTGPLDLSGSGGVAGPGASARYTTTQSFSGGAGGSFASKGGNTGAATFGDPTLVPLLGGMTGQDAGGKGGGGGGALQITAGEQIQVTGTIDAGGGGGSSGYASTNIAGAGGGGSGGAILLEAPTVIVTGAVVANGGGGGGGGGNAGSGGTGVTAGHGANPGDPAGGGFGQDGAGCPLYGYVVGGDGGTGATGNSAATNGQAGDTDSRCIGAESFVGGGGGGGGVGRIRVNTTTGCQCGGTVSPNATFGTLAKH